LKSTETEIDITVSAWISRKDKNPFFNNSINNSTYTFPQNKKKTVHTHVYMALINYYSTRHLSNLIRHPECRCTV